MTIIDEIAGKIIVSSQAAYGEPFYDEKCMLAMMQSVVTGGAGALRLAGSRDVKNAKKYFNLPVIGLTKPKELPANWKSVVYITPTLEDVKALINAGADIIAFDGTSRERNVSVEEIVSEIHNSNRLAMADISTFEEGEKCAEMGCDIISTTLSGYTDYTETINNAPDFDLLKELVKNINKPVILEGRIWTVDDVKKAFKLGAHCVVIGSAITRPQLITKHFVEGVRGLS